MTTVNDDDDGERVDSIAAPEQRRGAHPDVAEKVVEVRQGEVVRGRGWRWRKVACDVCATTIFF